MSNGPLSTISDVALTTSETSQSLSWRGWLIVLSISVAVCCFNLGEARTLTEHEIYVAGGAKQMSADRDWMFPKIGDHMWLEKPPLLHWLVVISARLLRGFSEVSVRLPSVIAGLGLVAVMTALAARWFGKRVAIFTGLLQTTMVYFITYARLAEAEMLLAFIVGVAIWAFVRLHSIGDVASKPNGRFAMLFWILIGVSNWAKGLGFGPALILVPCLVYLLWQRDGAAWRRMISWTGWILGLAIALAWPVIVSVRLPGARELWGAEIMEHAVGETGYSQPWWYYLTTAPWRLLPWTLALLIAGAPSLKRAWHEPDSPDRFIWCWVTVPILMLSSFSGKHHHYIIGCLCALTPLCAIGLLRCGTKVAVYSVGFVVLGTMFVHFRILPSYDRSRDDRDFLQSVRTFVPPNIPLAATGGQEIARHIFYVDPPPIGIWDSKSLAERFAGVPFCLVTRRKEETQLKALGQVQVLSESRHTRKEQSPLDRFTLFRIDPPGTSMAGHP